MQTLKLNNIYKILLLKVTNKNQFNFLNLILNMEGGFYDADHCATCDRIDLLEIGVDLVLKQQILLCAKVFWQEEIHIIIMRGIYILKTNILDIV